MPMPVTDYAGMADNMVELAGGLSGARKLIEKGIRAFHGSPHSFEKFDINKIGTGEGAQAFGHGLYFAENPAVAETYKNSPRVTDMDWRVLGGPQGWTVPAWVARGAQSSRGRAGEILADFENRVREHELNDPEFFNLGGLRNIRDALKGHLSGEMQFQKPGHMYEVNINAAPGEFLDWDRPIAQQGEAVQSLYRNLPRTKGADVYREYLDRTGAPLPGSGLHNMMREQMPPWEVSKQMMEAGVPGIRYHDQQSRAITQQITDARNAVANIERNRRIGTPEHQAWQQRVAELEELPGTRNYTVFDDKLIDILRKYGMAGLAGPALAAAGFNTEKQQ